MDQPSQQSQWQAATVHQWQLLRPYVWATVGLFVVGIVLGIGLIVADIALFELLGLGELGEALPDELTVGTILVNNTQAFLMLIIGAITFGILTVWGVVFNGVVVGYVATPVAAEDGIAEVLVLLAPHGVLELPAVFVAAAVGLRLVHIGINRLRGQRDQLFKRYELQGLIGIIGVAWIVLAVAAVIEVYLTPALFELLFGSPVES